MFGTLDKDYDGYIKTTDLGALIRALGQNPTDTEIQEYIKECDTDGMVIALLYKLKINVYPFRKRKDNWSNENGWRKGFKCGYQIIWPQSYNY